MKCSLNSEDFFVVTFVEFYCYTVKYIFETRKDRAMFLCLFVALWF